MQTIILLIISNTFMNLAWYGHLKFHEKPLWLAILVSWLIAAVEYMFAVPANRIGVMTYSVPQLKIMQECITLLVFTIVATVLFGNAWKWNYLASYGCIAAAVYFAFKF